MEENSKEGTLTHKNPMRKSHSSKGRLSHKAQSQEGKLTHKTHMRNSYSCKTYSQEGNYPHRTHSQETDEDEGNIDL